MVSPYFFLNITLAVLADSIEVGQEGGDIKRLSPLELVVVIIVLGLIIYFGSWAKYMSTKMGENPAKCRAGPESETLKSHK